MPVGDLAGWHQTSADDFTGSSLSSSLYSYSGQPGGDPGGWWDPSHVGVSGGDLNLTTSIDASHCGPCVSYKNYVSGGVATRTAQTYGMYSARIKLADAHGVSFAGLLWPTVGWPPEIDWVEGAGDYSTEYSSLHFNSDNEETVKNVVTDMSAWHIWTVKWTAQKIVYSLDGVVYGTVTGSNVPSQPMTFAFQSQTWNCAGSPIWTCPDSSTPASSKVQIDWMVTYSQD